jgi:transposase-like protein
VLNYDEVEAIRLCYFTLYGQSRASQIMGISRPTFTRIYESARRKVAEAFVQARPIIFEGGKVYFNSEWFSCRNCKCWFNHPEKEKEVKNCALCGSENIELYKEEPQEFQANDIYVCPHCGFEKNHTLGIHCNTEICPECNNSMVRKGTPRFRKQEK